MMTLNGPRGLRQKALAISTPVLRILPPWWKVRIYSRLADHPFQQGGHSGRTASTRILPHRYEMELRLDDWMERFAFVVGCYYEVDATATVLRLLRSGDCFIDVGANLGFLTLTGSRAVGPAGRVMAFEPNTTLAGRLKQALRVNKISNVTLFEQALGNADGRARLDTGTHSGTANLRGGNATGMDVEVKRGDSVVTGLDEGDWVLVKVDVEGYEQRVLQGFSALIERPRTAFLVEVTEQWLQEVQGSAAGLFTLLQNQGYQAYLPHLSSFGGIHFTPVDGPCLNRHQYDVLFLRTQDGWLSRRRPESKEQPPNHIRSPRTARPAMPPR